MVAASFIFASRSGDAVPKHTFEHPKFVGPPFLWAIALQHGEQLPAVVDMSGALVFEQKSENEEYQSVVSIEKIKQSRVEFCRTPLLVVI